MHLEISLGPVIAGMLGIEARTLALPLGAGGRGTLRDVLECLQRGAPGTLLEPATGLLHRYVHVYVNRRLVSDLERQVGVADRLRVDMRLIEGG